MEEAVDLTELARIANEAAAKAANIDWAIKAGQALLDAKAQVPRGQWLPWLAENFTASVDTAGVYMKLARNSERARNSPSIRQGLAKTNGHKVPREPRPPEVRQHQASINLLPQDWTRFKSLSQSRFGSAAAGLGMLVEDYVEADTQRRGATAAYDTECGVDDSFAEALDMLDRQLDNFTRFRRDPAERGAISSVLAKYIDKLREET